MIMIDDQNNVFPIKNNFGERIAHRMTKLKLNELKKELKEFEQKRSLIQLITELYKMNRDVQAIFIK